MNLLFAALLTATVTATAASSPGPALKVTFIGNAAVHLTDGRSTLVTDFPYQSGAFGYMTYDIARVPMGAENTAVLITHAHADHFAPELLLGRPWKVYGPPQPAGAVTGGQAVTPGTPARHGEFEILAFATAHAEIEHYSYLVTWRGRRLSFSGDTEKDENLLSMRSLDVAFASPWLLSGAAKAGKRVDARKIVVYHHRGGQTRPSYPGSVVPKQGEAFSLPPAAASSGR